MEIRQSLELHFLTCKLCGQAYREPKVLECMHTFCRSCLEDVIEKERVRAEEAERAKEAAERANRYAAASSHDYSSGYRRKWSSRLRYYGSDYSSTTSGSRYGSTASLPEKAIICVVCDKKTVLARGGVANLPDDHLTGKLASLVERMPSYPVCDVCTQDTGLLGGGSCDKINLAGSNLAGSNRRRRGQEDDGNESAATTDCGIAGGSSARARRNRARPYATGTMTTGDEASSSDSEGDADDILEESEENDGDEGEDEGGEGEDGDGASRLQNGAGGRRGRFSHRRRKRPAKARPKSTATSETGGRRSFRRQQSTTSNGSSGSGPQQPRRAESACLECAKRLCSKCRLMHLSMPVTSSHVIIRVDQMDGMRCTRHPREVRRFYCRTCQTFICLVCTFDSGGLAGGSPPGSINGGGSDSDTVIEEGHANHDVLSMKQAVETYQNQLDDDTSEAQEKAEQLEIMLGSLRICEAHLSHLHNAINQSAAESVRQIRERQAALLAEVDSSLGVRLESLNAENTRLAAAIDNWYAFVSDVGVPPRLDNLDVIEALNEAGGLVDKVETCLRAISEPLPRSQGWQRVVKEVSVIQARASLHPRRGANSAGVGAGSTGRRSSSSDSDGSDDDSGEDEPAAAAAADSGDDADGVRAANGKEASAGSSRSLSVRRGGKADSARPLDDKQMKERLLAEQEAQLVYWRARLGEFRPGSVDLGCIITPEQMAAEVVARATRFPAVATQTPTDAEKAFLAGKDSRRHRAIQVNFLDGNMEDSEVQTDSSLMTPRTAKVDTGTQYVSSDVNTPISFFRGSNKIHVQK